MTVLGFFKQATGARNRVGIVRLRTMQFLKVTTMKGGGGGGAVDLLMCDRRGCTMHFYTPQSNFVARSSLNQGPQHKSRFYYRREVKTGFCLRDFGQTNEQQCKLNEVDSIQTNLKPLFTQQYM
jgi:hypothetical protein